MVRRVDKMTTPRSRWLTVQIVGLSSLSLGAHAQTYDPYAILGAFNVIVPGTYSSANDIEGRAIIGTLDGANGSQQIFASNLHAGTDGPTTLTDLSNSQQTTYGSLNIVTINATTGGGQTAVTQVTAAVGTFADVTNRNNVPVTINGCNVNCVVSTPALNMSAFTAPLNALQVSLAALSTNSNYSFTGSKITFNLGSNSAGVAVFNITAAMLQTATEIIFTGTAASAVINVTGQTYNNPTEIFDYTNSVGNPVIAQNNIVWNFETATAITMNNWQGTVLAGDATVTNYNPIEGTLYALNFNGHGEVHDYPFQPTTPPTNPTPTPTPSPSPSPTPTPTPEPGTMAVLASGIAGIAALRRRRRKV